MQAHFMIWYHQRVLGVVLKFMYMVVDSIAKHGLHRECDFKKLQNVTCSWVDLVIIEFYFIKYKQTCIPGVKTTTCPYKVLGTLQAKA